MKALPSAVADDLVRLSREIHGDPELAYQERRAAARIAALLERHGHGVQMGIGGLETAFRARSSRCPVRSTARPSSRTRSELR